MKTFFRCNPRQSVSARPWGAARRLSTAALFVLLPALLAAIHCGPRKDGDSGPNRAGAYCAKLGYTTGYGLVDGKSSRVCVFPNKKRCELWSFYRGRCGKRFTKCEKNGFIVRPRIEELQKGKVEYAVCLFDDGSECVEQDFVLGSCKRTECKQWRFARGGCIRAPSPT